MANRKHNLRVVPSLDKPETAIERRRPNPTLDKFLDDLLGRLAQIDAAVGLARDTVFREAGENDELSRAWCAMDLGLKELSRVSEDLDNALVGRVPS
jgi:hypothetical protein